MKSFLEKKYATNFNENEKGFFAPGLLGVFFSSDEEILKQRFKNLTNMAQSAWDNRHILTQMETLLLAAVRTTDGLSNMKAQIRVAKKIKRQPAPVIYEEGKYESFYYIVFNDFFEDACT